jgi:signal transduction histidine kinase
MMLRPALRVLCAGLLLWIAGASPASSATRNVFVLYDERLDLPGLAALDADLVGTLRSKSADHIEVYREAMDLSRFDTSAYKILLRDFLRGKYADKKIDVAVAILGPALDFLLSHGETIFPGTPIVFCGLDKDELRGRSLPSNVHGILVERAFAPTLELVLGLHPQTKRVTVVAGTSEFDSWLLRRAREEFHPYENRLAFTYLTALPLEKQLTELSHLPPDAIVLFTTLFRDGAGKPFIPHDVVPRVSAAASRPVYGFLDQYLGRGIVGGSLYSFSSQGTEAAKQVLQILAEPLHSRPSVLESPAMKVLFDWRQMRRWGIGESSLPAGSEIRFREATVWELYRQQILLVGLIIFVQAALISWLLFERHRRLHAEVRARDMMFDLLHLNRMATAGELSASIAHEVNQPLAGMVANASAGIRWLGAATPDIGRAEAAFKQIVAAGHHAGDVIASVRALFKRGAEERVDVQINQLIRNAISLERVVIERREVLLRLDLAEPLPDVLGDRVQLLQVMLNLIRNAIEAMTANRPRILRIKSQVDESGDVVVSVEDSGMGIDRQDLTRVFDPLFTTKQQGLGIGLSICKTIIEGHHGRLWVTSAVGEGSTFYVNLPRYKPGNGWSGPAPKL